MIFKRNGAYRLFPTLILAALLSILIGGLTSFALGAFKGGEAAARPQLIPYPKLSDELSSRINELFDPQLPFNESVVADAFQDRAHIGEPEAAAALQAPVTARLTPPTSGYGSKVVGGSAPALQNQPPAPASQVDQEAEARTRLDEARKKGVLGTPQEATLYKWSEVSPLGIVGFQQTDGEEVREVGFKSPITGRLFTARRGTQFADATLVQVTTQSIIFRDSTGLAHEVPWHRKQPRSSPSFSQQPFVTGSSPASAPLSPSGYAENMRSVIRRQP